MVGFSALMAQDEETTLSRLAQCREIIDGLIENYHGRIVGTAGDSVLAEFASAVDAVRAATEIQDALRTSNNGQPPNRQAHFRIGINVGDVIEKDGDLLGDGVNVAARLQSLAEAGGICIAGSVYDQIQGKLNLEFGYEGERNLKNIPRPVHVFHLRKEGHEEEIEMRSMSIRPPSPAEPERPKPQPAAVAKPKREAKPPKPPRPPRENPWPKIHAALSLRLSHVMAQAQALAAQMKERIEAIEPRQRLLVGGGVAGVLLILIIGTAIYSFLPGGSAPTPEEAQAWIVLQTSDKPEDFDTFLTAFPSGVYAGEAKARQAELQKKKEEADVTKQQAEEAAKTEQQKARAERAVRPRPKPTDTASDTAQPQTPAPAEQPKPAAPEAPSKIRFDGHWAMRTQCPTLLGERGFVDERQFQIQNGAFISWTNSAEGKRGFEGSVTPEGKLSARGNAIGQTGIVLLEVKAAAEGNAKFTGDVWWDRRQCSTVLTKQ